MFERSWLKVYFVENSASPHSKMDDLSPTQRSDCMSRIRSKNTLPEKLVRRILHAAGYRFRLYSRALAGCPDIILPRYRKAILVHGCFWHMHRCRFGRVVPKTNSRYWRSKRMGNVVRDHKNIRALRRTGWRVLVVWECWTKDQRRLEERIKAFLSAK